MKNAMIVDKLIIDGKRYMDVQVSWEIEDWPKQETSTGGFGGNSASKRREYVQLRPTCTLTINLPRE